MSTWDRTPISMLRALYREANDGPIAYRLWKRVRLPAMLAAMGGFLLPAVSFLLRRVVSTAPIMTPTVMALFWIGISIVTSLAWIIATAALAHFYARHALRVTFTDSTDMRLLPLDSRTRILGMLAPFAGAVGIFMAISFAATVLWYMLALFVGMQTVGPASSNFLWMVMHTVAEVAIAALRYGSLWLLGVGSCLLAWRRAADGNPPWMRTVLSWPPVPAASYLVIAFVAQIVQQVTSIVLWQIIFTWMGSATLVGVTSPLLSFGFGAVWTIAIWFLLRWRWRKDFAVASERLFQAAG